MKPAISTKTMIATSIAMLFCTSAMAMSTYESKSLSCADIQMKVKEDKMLVLRFPSSSHTDLTLYSRAVSNSMACLGQGNFTGASVPSADVKSCKIKTCAFTTGKGPNKNH